jgi:hypothetical protein
MAKEHPNKHIREVVKYAITVGWRLTELTGHVGTTLVS